MSDEVHHYIARRHAWDGTVSTYCGMRFPKAFGRETFINWPSDCPGCRAAHKNGTKR